MAVKAFVHLIGACDYYLFDEMWNAVVYEEEKNKGNIPCSRSKHSVTLLGSHLYILAGRNGNLPLKDFWRFDLGSNKWELLRLEGEPPPSLQEHTAVAHKENIYVFGGELGFSAGTETPLWVYESKKKQWRKMKGQKGANVPKGRRGHTTLVHRGSALTYGGYCDLRGSSNELWVFHFDTESWHLLMNGRTDPPGRHKHSAVIHEDCMWIYGGMTDLQERSDSWRFDIVKKKWANIKCKYSPGPLHSHAVCKLPSSMLLFGGERSGQLINELWRFHFGTETWQRIETDVIGPQPLSECCIVTVSELLLHHSDDKKNEENSPPAILRRQKSSPSSTRRELHSPMENRRSFSNSSFPNRGSDRCIAYNQTGPHGVMIPPRRQATTPNSCNLSILKEISKLSQMNLSRVGPTYKCSYHALSSNESVNFEETSFYEENGTNGDLKSPQTPSASMMVLRERTSLANTPVTPSDAAKLVYLEDEQAPEYRIEQKASQNRNRRSYPSANSVRFAEPLVSPQPSPITSDYASCENLHKILARTPVNESVCFTNPNYTGQQIEKLGRGNYVKLNSPADSALDDYEMTEMRPRPPRSLPLGGPGQEKRKKYQRACSVGRAEGDVGALCVYLVGGRDQSHTTAFRKPISIWKLTLSKNIY